MPYFRFDWATAFFLPMAVSLLIINSPMKQLILLLSLLQSAATWLPFHTTEYIPLWKLTIVLVEFGHYLAVFSFGICALAAWQSYKNWKSTWTLAAILSLYGAIVFILPSVKLLYNFTHWQTQLEAAFGKDENSALSKPSLANIFLPKQTEQSPKLLSYAQISGEKLELLFYPAKIKSPAPWVLVVHGGGWNSGDKNQLPELNSILAENGIAVASIDYRLAPKYQWPAQKIDVQNAVQYLKLHALELGIDPSKWVILGRSAGGQIAESVAFEGIDPSLKGCIAFYAPADMNFAYRFAREDDILRSRSLIRDYLGGDPIAAHSNFDVTSPINFVRPNTIPTLLFHSPLDSLVWVKQSERLNAKLQEMHVASAYIEIPWATHGFDFNIHGPSGQLSTYAIRYFLDRVFKN